MKAICFIAFLFSVVGLSAEVIEVDVCVYGGTSGGVSAAVQTARMGKTVVVAEPGRHLGGMTSGGLSSVDIGDPRTVGGIAREYFTRLVGGYGKTLEWDMAHTAGGGGATGHGTGGAYAIEPHRAERLFDDMLREAKVPVHFGARLASVKMERNRLTEITTEEGKVFRAKMFIDTTYEGDLMAKAGVGFTLMREGNAKYGESLNGIQFNERFRPRGEFEQPGPNGRLKNNLGVWDRDFPLDPYVTKGDPKSGLLPLIDEGEPGHIGDPASGVQAYCYRLCLTTDPANMIPITPPAGYDPKRYEIVVRFIEACVANGDDMDLRWFSKHDPLPNHKWDFNTATFGGNLPGASHAWPEADYARREEIAREHENYHRGLLHFLSTDRRVPEKVRRDMKRYGLPKDEFKDTNGWPHQLYIREARRMVGDLVMTEHHTYGKSIAPKSVGLGSYGTDVHEIRRIVKDGVVIREGKVAATRGDAPPYPIGYDAIVPKESECANLFVTFALSASHTAFASIRMEPVFMVTSQSAATAACQAIDDGTSVQKVDYGKLRTSLMKDRQVIEWPPGKPAEAKPTSGTTPLTKPTGRIVYKKTGDEELHLDVFKPQGWKADDKRPCYVAFHGGGWGGGAPSVMYRFADHFTKAGMVGVCPQYRLFKPGTGVTVAECVKDARSAVRYLRSHASQLGIDPRKIIVCGASAGGHLAAATAMFDVDEAGEDTIVSCTPDALVLLSPVIDTSPEGYGSRKIGDQWESMSPAHRVRAGLPPTITFHGTADTTTPFKGARLFHEAMLRAGNRSELVSVEGGIHTYMFKDKVLFHETLDRMDAFLDSLGVTYPHVEKPVFREGK